MKGDTSYEMATAAAASISNVRNDVASDLQNFRTDFQRDLRALRQLMTLRADAADTDDEYLLDQLEPFLSSMSAQLSRVQSAVTQYRSYIQAERAQLNHLSEIRKRVISQKHRIAAIKKHLPPHVEDALDNIPVSSTTLVTSHQTLSKAPKPPSFQTLGEVLEPDDDGLVSSTPLSATSSRNLSDQNSALSRKASSSKGPSPTGTAPSKPPPLPRGRSARNRTGDSAAPNGGGSREVSKSVGGLTVRPPTEQELAKAPQYVKGRLTIESLNKVAQKLSEIATSKYDLLRKPNSALNPAELSHCQAFREAFCDETTGKKFITDSEIKGFGEYRIDSTVKTAINVLRHVGSLKEIHGSNRTRILIINESS